jgi:DNA-binding transcriptional LysR family regulator
MFLNEARAVLLRVDEATATVRAVASGHRGELHIGYAPSLTVELLPLALRRFQQRAPGVKVTLHDLSTEALLAGLREKRLHAALMIRPSPRAQRGLVFEEIRRYPVCVACSPTHRLAGRRRVSLGSLNGERLIAYGRSEYPEYHEWLADLFRSGDARPRVSEEHDSATSLIAAVEAGHGVAIVPEVLACLAGPRLTLRRVAGALEPFSVGVARCAGKPAALVADFVAAAMA